MADEGTTIWVDRKTKEDLIRLAKANDRSAAAQLRWIVKREIEALEAVKDAAQQKNKK
jgi:hypothetical protein